MSREPVGMLFDMVRCSGCRKCVGACMDIHHFEGDPKEVTDLSATACTSMTKQEDYDLRNLCRHCIEPSCVSVCPVGALIKTELGPVTYDADRCIGCRYCMVACPFNIPRYEWDNPVPSVQKCDLCIDRLQKGEIPACAEACEYEATVFGTREELLALARERIEEDPDEYDSTIFGEHEIGGTSVLFLAPHPDECAGCRDALGYKKILGTEPLPGLTLKQLDRVPSIVVGGSAALMAIWWITNRRDEVALAEGRPHGEGTRTSGNGNGSGSDHHG